MNAIVKNNASVACEWAENLPENWEFRLLKRDFVVTLGKMLQSVQHNETETEECYLRSANLRWEGVDITDVRKMWFAPQEKKKLALQYGDLLVSEGGDVGRTSFWQNELSNCYIQNAINRVRARKKDSTRFLYYWLHLIKSIGYIDAVVSRITIAHLTAEKLERILSIKPPIPVQHRIAVFLDKTCAAIDKAIEAKQQQLETLDALRKSIIHKAVTRGLDDSVELRDSGVEWLGMIPSTWRSQRIKDVTKLSPGFSAGKPTMVDLCTVIPMEAVSENGEISTDQRQEFNSISGGLTNFEVGDIIFAKITPCMENGKGAYITALPTKYAFGSTEFHVLRPSDKVDGKFLYYYTFNSVYRKYAEKNMTGAAGQKRVSSIFLKYTRIYLPDVITQRHIADYLDEKCSELTELQANIVTQISTLEQYRKSLLHECVTGKRRITEDDMQDQL